MNHSGRRHHQSGVAAVELGLLLVVLIPLVFGISEYGRAMYQYNTIGKSVRAGARYLSQYAAGDTIAIGRAKCLVAYGNVGCNGTELVPGLNTSSIQVWDVKNRPSMRKPTSANGVTVGVSNLVQVTVTQYDFVSVVPLVVRAFKFDDISVTMTQAMP